MSEMEAASHNRIMGMLEEQFQKAASIRAEKEKIREETGLLKILEASKTVAAL